MADWRSLGRQHVLRVFFGPVLLSDTQRPAVGVKLICMIRKASVVIEKDENRFYAWCPELKGCQSQGTTLEEAIANIKEAIELYLETLPIDERDVLLSREILTTAVEVDA